MTKRYSVARNRWYARLLVNEPWFYERDDDDFVSSNNPRMRMAMMYTAMAVGLIGGLTR